MTLATPTQPNLRTWEVLQSSRNTAAVTTLGWGLVSSDPNVRHLSLKALLARGEPAGYALIVQHWDRLEASDLAEAHGWIRELSHAAARVLVTGDLREKRSAMQAIEALDVVGAIDGLLEIMVDPRHALAARAREIVLSMCQRWGMYGRNRNEDSPKRKYLVERLFHQIAQYHDHQNQSLLDAWLQVVSWEDAQQKAVVSDPRLDAYRPLVQKLKSSSDPRAVQLLGGYLWKSSTPQSILQVLVEKKDAQLAIEMASLLSDEMLPLALKRLRRLPTVKSIETWVEQQPADVDPAVEQRLWVMLAATCENLERVFAGAKRMYELGTSESILTAGQILLVAKRPELNDLLHALCEAKSRPDSSNNLVNLVHEIAGWTRSPVRQLQRAATEFFHEFTLENLLQIAKREPEDIVLAMANIVRITQDGNAELLSRELNSPASKRRTIALQLAGMLGCVGELEAELLEILDDPYLAVRAKAIELLSQIESAAFAEELPRLANDINTDIQIAARQAARRIAERPEPTQPDLVATVSASN